MSVNKFKVGDVVKCVYSGGFINLTVGKEYLLEEVCNAKKVKVKNDKGCYAYYNNYLFELSGANAQQPPKFNEGDMVYLIGFGYFKPCELTLSDSEYLSLKFKVMMDDIGYETFTEDGYYSTDSVETSIVLATEENRQMLNRLLGVEYEPVKLTGSDLAKKMIKDNQQTCYVSDVSDEHALSKGCVDLIVKFEGGFFVSWRGLMSEHAVPCNEHGEVLMDEQLT